MRVAFGVLKGVFKSASIYFTNNGKDRFLDNDLVSYSEGCIIEPNCGFLAGNILSEMGSFSYSWSALPLNSRVGRYCSIAPRLKIIGTRHPMEWVSTSSFTYDSSFPIFKDLNLAEGDIFKTSRLPASDSRVFIGHDVWIGADVTLKPGITIGTGSVIAASSVVVKDVPPYSVVGGNPAKIIKSRFDSKTVNRLLASEWWNYKFTDFAGMDVKEPLKFCDKLDEMVKACEIEIYAPSKIVLESVHGAIK